MSGIHIRMHGSCNSDHGEFGHCKSASVGTWVTQSEVERFGYVDAMWQAINRLATRDQAVTSLVHH